MIAFIAAAAILLGVAALIAHKLKTNDTHGLKASRREAAEKARHE